ncbi:type IV toxin-antitoxin system AbiEi family antitoxin domain-containing protein [Ornithinimicrobium cryptoxanthini]|uniref:type IV toxin-antitoxin system AbiEi family antitoxin domain-containing protein n=1 Tax=Ornithinimicrobium cryptoxanthini TaxID=2934161 RepID=UPI0021181856|nr:type IV toxin-antitoxin system AbiEi family antitoxin domain-containing protein [Ornithinimicrobium cryptoxanthini]
MQEIIAAYLDGPGKGIITAAEARRLGCGPTVLRAMVRNKLLLRVARGVYVSAKLWNPPSGHPATLNAFALQEHRHLLRLDALLRNYGSTVAASHQSAVLVWGLPTQSASLERVHLVHTTGGRTARRHDTFSIHTCELDGVLTRHQGRLVVSAALAAIGQAITVGVRQGVAAMDAAIVAGHATKTEITTTLEMMRHTPKLGLARRAANLTDGLAESPGESSLRLVLIELGIDFVAQHWIHTETGHHYYRVDFYLPKLGVVLEYDGQVKYDGARDGRVGGQAGAGTRGTSGRLALAQEKAREDDLRLDGFGVGRVTAGDLAAQRVAKIIAAARRQAQPRALRRRAEPPPWARRG